MLPKTRTASGRTPRKPLEEKPVTEPLAYKVVVRNSADDAERPEPGPTTKHLGIAEAKARRLSRHPVPDLRPFYTLVFDGVNALPVSAYRNGTELSERDVELLRNTPHRTKGAAFVQPGTGRAEVITRLFGESSVMRNKVTGLRMGGQLPR
jgi:hypothetical protein